MKNKGGIYKIISVFTMFFLLVLSGCNQLPTGTSFSTEGEASVGNDVVLETVTDADGRPIYSIADYDWEIKAHPYGKSDNLYELSIDTLHVSSDNVSIVALKAVDEQFIVICQDESTAAVAYMVNPLTMQITAFCNLPKGTYSDNGVRVNDKGEIEIWNEYHHELFVFNKKLQELEHITIWNVRTSVLPLPISSDHKYVYYKDADDGYLYAYQTETETRTKIFPDINVLGDDTAIMLGLLRQDSCLAFRYYDKETKEYVYEVREIATGTVLHRDTSEISGIETSGDTYLLRHFEDGLSEIVFGKEADEVPHVISLKDYAEYEQTVTDIRTESVISCLRKEDARDTYQELVNQDQETVQDEKTQRVSMLTLQLYDLATGTRQCALEFDYTHELQDSPDCKMIYLKKADCVICMVEDSVIRWLVWDLTKDNSKIEDDTNYIYKWQNPEEPDYEELVRLTQQAEQIMQQYSVEIYFGDSILKYTSHEYEYLVSTNTIRIEKMLNILEKALDKYPEGMLAQLGEKSTQEGHLQIHLAGEIIPVGMNGLDNASGCQSSIDGIPYIVLDINCVTQLERMVYHEIFHAIEWRLNYVEAVSQTQQVPFTREEWEAIKKSLGYLGDYLGDYPEQEYDYNGDIFFNETEWSYFNPDGFRYDKSYRTSKKSRTDDYTVGTDEAYFVDVYSKSFPTEDRARIMEYAMLDAEDEQRKNVESFWIQAKLMYISREIRRGFDTTGWPEKTAWEMAITE